MIARVLAALRRYAGSERGNAATEFALALPLMALTTLGAINLCLLLYANVSLHNAAESTARCIAVTSATCDKTSQSSLNTYGRARFYGVGSLPTFTWSNPSTCTNKITATSTFKLITGVKSFDVPMTASACYPLQP